MPANTTSLKTVFRNPTAVAQTYPFIGPHGVTLAAGATAAMHGDPYYWIRKTSSRDRANLDAALMAGLLEIVSSPQAVFQDQTSLEPQQLQVAGGAVVAAAPSWGEGGGVAGPYVVSTTPAAGAKGIPSTSTIVATFSGAVTGVVVTVATGVTNVAGTLVASAGNTVYTFTPGSSLTGGSAYQVAVAGGTDGAAIVMQPYAFGFSVAPTWTLTPANAATGVATTGASVAAVFNVPVSGATIVVTQAGAAVAGATAISNSSKTYTFTPTGGAWTAGKTFTVVTANAVDTNGNKIAGTTTTFST